MISEKKLAVEDRTSIFLDTIKEHIFSGSNLFWNYTIGLTINASRQTKKCSLTWADEDI